MGTEGIILCSHGAGISVRDHIEKNSKVVQDGTVIGSQKDSIGSEKKIRVLG